MKPKAKYKRLDKPMLELLRQGRNTPGRLANLLGVDIAVSRTVLRRLKSQGLIIWPDEKVGAKLKYVGVTEDPSPFPRPTYDTPAIGWLG